MQKMNPNLWSEIVFEWKLIFLNGLPAIIIDSTDTMNGILKLYDISKKSFLSYNDILSNEKLKVGIPYYFIKKRNKGRVQIYNRRKKESLWEISQIFGVKLNQLKKFNKNNLSDRIVLRRRIFNF
jgi:membrane-bound lytic murein transglycosylase D